MKILEVIFYLRPGGAERFVVDLSNELYRCGHDVTLLTLKDDTVQDRKFYCYDIKDGVKYMNLGLPEGISFKSMYLIYKAIKSLSPDVVHLHTENVPFFSLFGILKIHSKIKFIETIHNSIPDNYCTALRKIYFNTLGRFKWVRFACLSQTNIEDMKRLFPYCESIKIVNGRAPQSVTPLYQEVCSEMSALRSSDESVLLLNIARCNSQKNHRRLITAVNELNREGVHVDVAIIGAGYNDTDLGHELQSISTPNIHFLGTRKNISDYLFATDAFCLSSDFEGMPITLIEALLCGTPAISTPVCGSVDAIADGYNGILSKDFTVEEYKIAIRRFIDKRKELKKNAFAQKDKTEFAISSCAEKYIEFFNS